MALATMIYKTPQKSIGGITVDAFLSENYTFTNQVSELPIEEGSTVTDNIVEEPFEITIEGFFGKYEFQATDTMSDSQLQQLSNKIPNFMQRVNFYYQELLRLKQDRQPITIVTGLDTFDSMVITSLNIPRDVSSGADLHFTMTLRKLPIVNSETVQISVNNAPKSTASNTIQTTANVGVQSKQEASDDKIKQIHKNWVQSGMMKENEYVARWGEPYIP